jgi:transcription-repair coupling factor (superfamily II helicase)
MYKRVAGVESESQLADVRAELADRYGPLPPAVGHLLEYAALRLTAAGQGVTMIERRRNEVQVHFSSSSAIDPGRLARFVAGERGAQFTPAGVLKFPLKSTQASEVLARLRELLLHLAPAEAVTGAARATLTTTEKA